MLCFIWETATCVACYLTNLKVLLIPVLRHVCMVTLYAQTEEVQTSTEQLNCQIPLIFEAPKSNFCIKKMEMLVNTIHLKMFILGVGGGGGRERGSRG